MNKVKKIILILFLCYLPYFSMITYDRFSNNFEILTYPEELLFLLLGPIKLFLLGPKEFIFGFTDNKLNYIAIIPAVIMLISIVIGIWKFNKSKFYKILFAIGMLIWFLFGFIAVGIHYITV